MKETTKLIKTLGQYLLGSKGKIQKKIVNERHEILMFETPGKKVLGLEYDIPRGTINILQEFDRFDCPSYRIPRRFVVCNGNYEFGKCPICGNLAIMPIIPPDFHGFAQGTCIEPPNFHSFPIETKGKARE